MYELTIFYKKSQKIFIKTLIISFFIQSCSPNIVNHEMHRGSVISPRGSIFEKTNSRNPSEGDGGAPHFAINGTESSITDLDSNDKKINANKIREPKKSRCLLIIVGGIIGFLLGIGLVIGITYPIMNNKINNAQSLYANCETRLSELKKESNDTNTLITCQNNLNSTSIDLSTCQAALNANSAELFTCNSNLANCVLSSNTPGTNSSTCSTALDIKNALYTECSDNYARCAIVIYSQVAASLTDSNSQLDACNRKLVSLCQLPTVTGDGTASFICLS